MEYWSSNCHRLFFLLTTIMSSHSSPSISFLSITGRNGINYQIPLGSEGPTVNGSTCHSRGRKLPISVGPAGGDHDEYDPYSSVDLHDWPQSGHKGRYQVVRIPLDGQTTIIPLRGGGTQVFSSRVVNPSEGFEIHQQLTGTSVREQTICEEETEDETDARGTGSMKRITEDSSSLGDRR
jgi:hypothetical protein